MGSALLSRFDLVFILLDKPDEEMDAMLSEHVMAMHAGGKLKANSTIANTTQQVYNSIATISIFSLCSSHPERVCNYHVGPRKIHQ
jgi:DNA replicative helicase MCM subunit Mcm2 (Cdc46/Mcm family)